MADQSTPTNLEEMLDRIEQAEVAGSERTTLRGIMSHVGRKSFGPVLLMAGLVTLVPVLGGIPGVPTIMAFVVLLVAGQLLLGRQHFWLPDWIMNRSIKRERVKKAVQWLRRPARFLDRFLRHRLALFTHGLGSYAVALMCVFIALMLPPMEFVPFSAVIAGVALTFFGLALMADDGLLALIAFVCTAITFSVVAYYLL